MVVAADHEQSDARGGQHLSFAIAGEQYAVPILQVKELIQYVPITRIPTLPPAIRGVVNLRGRVVPVVDLAVRFGLPESETTRWTCVVMVELMLDGEQSVVGVLADAVNQVVDFAPDDIADPPMLGTRVHADFLVGLGTVDGKLVQILRVERLLGDVIHGRVEKHRGTSADSLQASGEGPTR